MLPIAGVARADERDFTLVNNTSAVLTNLYVGPSASDSWGDDILGTGTMNPGDSVLVYFKGFDGSNCLYDILTNYDNGGQGKLMGIDLCSIDTVSFSDAG